MGTPFVDWTQLHGRDHRDHLPDFSFAGYHGGTAPVPISKTPTITIYPSGKDQTEEIQTALDTGGVVLLTPGMFILDSDKVLILRKHGSVLKGSGPGQTVIEARGRERKIIQLGAFKVGELEKKTKSEIMDDYVPVGATSVRVKEPKRFVGKIGQDIRLMKVASAKWIEAQGMHRLTRKGQAPGTFLTWLAPGAELWHSRKITALQDDRIFFDIPLTDSIDKSMEAEGYVQVVKLPKAASELGVESLTLRLFKNDVGNLIGAPTWTGISISSYVTDSWIANVHLEHFFAPIKIADEAKRLTIQDCVIRRPGKADTSKGHAADIETRGTETLILRCRSEEDKDFQGFAFMTQSRTTGPNALVAYNAPNSRISPHQRWATGLLVDNCEGKAIEFKNRVTMGSGHGQPMGNGVVWNSAFQEVMVESPPVGTNWAVGVSGKLNPKYPSAMASFTHQNRLVAPQSLYAYQLEQRLGPDAVRGVLNIQPLGVAPVVRNDLRPPKRDEL